MKKKVWFVTGASKGLGLTLVKRLLNEGYSVAATSRKAQELKDAMGNYDSAFFLPLETELTDETSVGAAIESTVQKFGTLDVVVNNAGYGLTGALEELTDEEARKNFNVNVFGSLNVIRKAMPVLRKQQSGHILNVSSIGGFTGNFPGFGIYCATKFAVQGFSESLSAETKAFNVHVTIVSPGYFRTNFLNPDSLSVPANQMPEYKTVREVQSAHQNDYNGNQAGDPEKAAAVIISVSEQAQPPLHLFLGQDAYDLAEQKMADVKKDMEAMRDVAAAATGF